jgi:voltage-gated potassium channel
MGIFVLVYLGLSVARADDPRNVPFLLLTPFIPIILAEFFLRLWASPSRKEYLKYHLVDLVACIPPIGSLRVFLIVRPVALGLRVVLATGRVRGRESFVFIAASATLLWAGCSYLVWVAERHSNPEFHPLGNALWWGIETITTVGYGDIVPITWEGRVLAGLTAIIGLGLIGVVASQITTLWIHQGETRDRTRQEILALHRDVRSLQEDVAAIRSLLAQQGSETHQAATTTEAASRSEH